MYNIITDNLQSQQQKYMQERKYQWGSQTRKSKDKPKEKRQTLVNKTLHRQRKIDKYELH
jgi:hypothetical protein